ncbi:hypothetical protein PMAYCL1PPCAC_08740, partial [Pristionchus mayeri]
EVMLISRVISALERNAFYLYGKNRVMVLAPYLYPEPTDNATLNKHYFLFNTISHEMFHSVVVETWANISATFKQEMECLKNHFNRTCGLYDEGSCNSGEQTFHEDGPDVEGMRVNYEFLTRNYNDDQLKEIVFTSDSLSVNREQAFFYLFGIEYCTIIVSAF